MGKVLNGKKTLNREKKSINKLPFRKHHHRFKALRSFDFDRRNEIFFVSKANPK